MNGRASFINKDTYVFGNLESIGSSDTRPGLPANKSHLLSGILMDAHVHYR